MLIKLMSKMSCCMDYLQLSHSTKKLTNISLSLIEVNKGAVMWAVDGSDDRSFSIPSKGKIIRTKIYK